MVITIRELAKLAGVSPSTVSRSLNDSPLIPHETRERIRQLAGEQGFIFNAIARSLSLGRTGTVALIFPDYFEEFSISLFFTALQRHVRSEFEAKNIDVLVAFPFNTFAGTSNIRKLVMSRKIDGMLIVDNEFDPADKGCLEKAGIPYLFLHKHPADRAVPDVDFYCTDHFAGGRLAAERLLSLGRKRILVVASEGEEFEARTAGFMSGIQDSGLAVQVDVVQGTLTYESGFMQAQSLVLSLSREIRYDGIFCQSDLMALGFISALRAESVQIPQEISVVGYDDIELGRDFHPSLTTVHQPLKEIAAMACDRLVSMIGQGCEERKAHRLETVRALVAPTLVIRES